MWGTMALPDRQWLAFACCAAGGSLFQRTSSPWVLGIAERVILGRGLGEPDVTTVTTEVPALESFSNVLLDNDSTTGSVDEP